MPPELIARQTYPVCKELCKEMSKSDLCGINRRFDAFETNFQTFVASQADLQAHVANQELQVTSKHVYKSLKLSTQT